MRADSVRHGAALVLSLLLITGCAPLRQLGGPAGPLVRVLLVSTRRPVMFLLKEPGWVSADGYHARVRLVPGRYRVVLESILQTNGEESQSPWFSDAPFPLTGPLAQLRGLWTPPARMRLEEVGGRLRLRARRNLQLQAPHIQLRKPRNLVVPPAVDFVLDSGEIAVVNCLPLETYLRGVVPAEMWSEAPLEALKAQAVVARTTAYRYIVRNRGQAPYDLCSSEACQVYLGTEVWSDRADRAIRVTAGELLTFAGRVCEAPYSAVCGGHTEDASLLWSGKPQPHLRGVLDAAFVGKVDLRNPRTLKLWLTSTPKVFCAPALTREPSARKYFRWRIRLSEAEIQRRVRKSTGVDVGVPLQLQVLRRGVSGRALEVLVQGPHGKVKIEGELAVRNTLAEPALPSSCFVLQKVGSQWELLGAGYGHGVGLCQAGAVGMARVGTYYKKILQHYYPGTRVFKKY